MPVGLTRVRDSTHSSFIGGREPDIVDVFALFDEIESWLTIVLPEVMQWIDLGLAVRYDDEFGSQIALAKAEKSFGSFLEYQEYRQAQIDNMDY